MRHTTAMHLLQSGVDITVIALWLGHEDPATTHLYVEADLAMKEAALKRVNDLAPRHVRFKHLPTASSPSCKPFDYAQSRTSKSSMLSWPTSRTPHSPELGIAPL